MTQPPSNGRLSVPRTRVESGFSTGNTFSYQLKRERPDVLVFGPKAPWKAAIWPVMIGLVLYIFEPLCHLVWRLVTLGNPNFNDPFFFDGFHTFTLLGGLCLGGMIYIFYHLARKWSPVTRFDLGNNLILRHEVRYQVVGIRASVEEVRMKVTEAKAIQLCYGGYEKGDSDSPGYDWWQLLVVGPGDPPLRAILMASEARAKMTRAGREIAKFLSVPWIDDGDYRDIAKKEVEISSGRVNDEGVFITSGSSTDEGTYLNKDLVKQEISRKSKVGDRILAGGVLIFLAGLGWLIWTLYSIEQMAQSARVPPLPLPGPSLTVELTELLTNGGKYQGRRVQTTGYVRFVTFLMNHYGKDHHLTLYSLSPEPLDLSKRIKGGTIGDLAVTNLMVHTTEWLDGSFSTGSDTNITPKRTVIGVFNLNGKNHNLVLASWAMAPDLVDSNSFPTIKESPAQK